MLSWSGFSRWFFFLPTPCEWFLPFICEIYRKKDVKILETKIALMKKTSIIIKTRFEQANLDQRPHNLSSMIRTFSERPLCLTLDFSRSPRFFINEICSETFPRNFFFAKQDFNGAQATNLIVNLCFPFVLNICFKVNSPKDGMICCWWWSLN